MLITANTVLGNAENQTDEALGRLNTLHTLSLGQNQLKRFPCLKEAVRNAVRILYLEFNEITEVLVDCIKYFTYLEVINISDNP